jgi:3-hydroxyacyl-CoA dehydrogenase
MSDKVALIGAGLIGRAWAIVFARAGRRVALYDAMPGVAQQAIARIDANLADLQRAGLVDDPAAILARIAPVATVEDAVAGAVHVQENGPEELGVKQALFRTLDAAAAPEAVLASSSSAIPASAFTKDLPGARRCLVAHPVNPPYLVPLVELAPAPWTAAETVARTRDLMSAVGQVPIEVRREIDGFILNRLQGALLNEALRLAAEGYASVEDIDKCVADGLGLRWSFMGPFETIDLNAPGGMADYAKRYGPVYEKLAQDRAAAPPPPWRGAALERMVQARRAALASDRLDERQAWRDRRLMALVAHKRRATREIGE